MLRYFAPLVALALSGCEKEPVSVAIDATEPPSSMRIVSGDGQSITQHAGATFEVEVVDGDGAPLVGVPVTFEGAPANTFKFSSTVTTSDTGHATAGDYIHATGTLQVFASTPDIESVTFTFQVTPTTHPYDGTYDCSDPADASKLPSALRTIAVADGVVSCPSALRQPTATVNESTGAVSIEEQIDSDYFVTMTGQLTLDTWQQGTGSGTYETRFHSDPPDSQFPHGTWTCTRR
jgi:hypothetical protein